MLHAIGQLGPGSDGAISKEHFWLPTHHLLTISPMDLLISVPTIWLVQVRVSPGGMSRLGQVYKIWLHDRAFSVVGTKLVYVPS